MDKDFLIGIVGIIFLLIISLPFVLFSFNGSQGEHTGYVTAVEFNDNLIWDDNLVYFKTDLESTQEDKYCVNDELLKTILEEHAKKSTKITIRFQHKMFTYIGDCNEGVSIIRQIVIEE